MVVDPAEESRTRLAAHFRALGYEVAMAADGVQALAQGLASGADVVIMSLALPGLDGYEVAAILSRVHPRIQIILTGDAGAEGSPRESEWSGCFRCFPKPLDVEAISRVLSEAEP
jgi:CheY-like chemotaxis protein